MTTKKFSHDRKFMKTISKVLKEYDSVKQFEEDYDCKLLTATGGISGVVFKSDSAMTAFYLKYNK